MITKQKGTYDIYGKDALVYKSVIDVLENYMALYNIDYIRTPIFEASELFHRSAGETSDVVKKETYDMVDRGDRNITLRPEGTAGVVRSFIENKLYGNRNEAIKYYYEGTMYRYERPQKGRNREFTQFGVEVFNSNSVITDAEVISLGYNALLELGLEEVTVSINSLGDKESKDNYINALKDFVKPNLEKLCPDCQSRYITNPLRIIDCKADKDNEVLKGAPVISDYLSDNSKNRLNELKKLLIMLEVDFEINTSIVRGLDYYTDVVYEFLNKDGIALGGGGRYDNLVESLEGPNTPATGFAFGLDRIILELTDNDKMIKTNNNVEVYIMAISDEEKYHALKISQNLRLNGIVTEVCTNDLSMKSQFKHADNLEAKYLIILNNEDLKLGIINIKDNATKEEIKLDENEIIEYFIQNL